jgi:iron complex outermembrane receptor protein
MTNLTNSMARNKTATFAALFLATTALSTSPANAATGKSHPPATAVDLAQASKVMAFTISAQPLAQALARYSDVTGVSFAYKTGDFSGIQSPGVTGSLTPVDALTRLLSGTGIAFEFTGARTVALSRPDTASRLTLGTVSVEGRRESAFGPVPGLIAGRSASGTKTDTPIAEVPQSISVVGATQMERQKTQTLGEALRYTPGILKAQGFNRTDDGFYVRGFQGSSESMYVDGLRGTTNVYDSMAEPYLLERIEVLRGPASVLYGQASPGGVINMVTKKPTADPINEVVADGGSFARKQVSADHGGRLDAEGRLTYRITALVRDSDTMVDYIPDDKVVAAPSLTWRPDDDTSLTVQAVYQKVSTMYYYGFPEVGTIKPNENGRIDRSRFIGEPDFNKFEREVFSGGYELEHRVTDRVKLKQNFRYSDFDNEYADIYYSSYQSGNQSVTRAPYARNDHSRTLTIDNQAHAEISTGPLEHTLVGGADFTHGTFRRVQYNGTVGALNLYSPSYGSAVTLNTTTATDSLQTIDQIGFYLQDQMAIGDHWRLLLGGRNDRAKTVTENYRTGATTTATQSALTGRVGAVYLFDNGLAPYASYTESFQPQTGTDASSKAFDPTTGQQYEVGIKFQPKGADALVTLSAYELTRQNVLTTDPDNTGFQVQTGEIRSRGIEVEAKANLTPDVTLLAGYAYTQAKVTKSNGTDLGNRPTNTPYHQASMWGEYAPQAGMLKGLVIGGGVRFVGNTVNLSSTAVVPYYFVADAMVSYEVGDLKMALNVSNILDNTYIAACTYGCFYGDARTVTGSLTYRW